MNRKSIMIALVVCSFALIPVAAQASTIINIGNPGFESPDLSATHGKSFADAKLQQEWQPIDTVGGYIFDNFVAPSIAARSGLQSGDLTGAGASHGYQQLMVGGTPGHPSDPLNPGSAFMFQPSDVGGVLTISVYERRRDAGSNTTFRMKLYSGATWAAKALVVDSGNFPMDDSYTLRSLIYPVTGATPVSVPLWLEIYNDNGNNSNQTLLDDFSGSFAPPVPEPSTLVLLAAGLVGLLCYAWRKRR